MAVAPIRLATGTKNNCRSGCRQAARVQTSGMLTAPSRKSATRNCCSGVTENVPPRARSRRAAKTLGSEKWGRQSQSTAPACATKAAVRTINTGLGALFILDDPIFGGLAVSLIFGIFVSTLLTLFVIPVVYYAYRYRTTP